VEQLSLTVDGEERLRDGDGDAGGYLVGELEHVGGMMRLSHFRSNDSFVPEGQERLGLAISRIGGRSGSPIERLVSVSIESHRIVADDRRVGRVWEWPLEVFSSEMDVLFLSPPSPPQSLGLSWP
jgi:hypothetical protein